MIFKAPGMDFGAICICMRASRSQIPPFRNSVVIGPSAHSAHSHQLLDLIRYCPSVPHSKRQSNVSSHIDRGRKCLSKAAWVWFLQKHTKCARDSTLFALRSTPSSAPTAPSRGQLHAQYRDLAPWADVGLFRCLNAIVLADQIIRTHKVIATWPRMNPALEAHLRRRCH